MQTDKKTETDFKTISQFEYNGTTFYLASPTAGDIREANFIYNKRFTEALTSGIFTRTKLEKEMENQNPDFFTDITKQRTSILDEIRNTEDLLEDEEVQKSPDQLESLSTILAIYRNQLVQMEETVNNLYANTAEEIATEDKRSFLLFRILKDKDGKRVYNSYEEFLDESFNDFMEQAKFELLCWEYNLDRNWKNDLPENLAMEKASKLRAKDSTKTKSTETTIEESAVNSEKPKKRTSKKTSSKKRTSTSRKTKARSKKASTVTNNEAS